MHRAPKRTLAVGSILLLGGLWFVRNTIRFTGATVSELADFHPHRGRIPLPMDARALGLQQVSFDVPGVGAVRGWYAPTHTGAAVVLLHGSGGDRREVLDVARALIQAGYGALLYDLPGHGESEGIVRYGAPERRALQLAMRFVLAQPGVARDRVGVYGFSIGAFLAAQVAAVDDRIRAVVLAAPPADAVAYTQHEYAGHGRVAFWGALVGLRIGGMHLDEPQPITLVHRIAPRPLLILTGMADSLVTPTIARTLYAAAGAPKRFWLVPGAGHGDYERALPTYGTRVRKFFDEAFAPAMPESTPARALTSR